MQLVVNRKLVRSRVRLASICHIGALAVFGIGLWISFSYGESQILGSYAAIVVGLLLYNVGQIYLRRWGPRFRQDEVLARALRGLDNRHTLLAFPSTKLPDYILVGPSGVQVIVPRSQAGSITCRNDRWSRETRGGLARLLTLFGGNPLGDPGMDLARGVQRVRERLRRAGLSADQEPPVGGVVVFTNPAVRLRVEGCTTPVTGLRQLRSAIGGRSGHHERGAGRGRAALGQESISRVVEALQA